MVFEKRMSVKDLIEQMRKELQEEKNAGVEIKEAKPKTAKAKARPKAAKAKAKPKAKKKAKKKR
jgi:hypothetical protein